MNVRTGTIIGWVALMGGCTSISGLSGASGYACKAPEGVACDSVSGVYANSLADRLPSRRQPSSVSAPSTTAVIAQPRPVAAARLANEPGGTPSTLRSSARILRLWVKPWEDADGDLIDQSHVYVQIDNGQWLIEHAQRQIRDAYAAVKPPPRLMGTTPAQGKEAGVQRPPGPSSARPVPSGSGATGPAGTDTD